jgi:hypothetical protein
MCFQVYFMLSHRLKGKWSLRRRQKASTPLHRTIHPSPSLHNALQFGIIFTLILFTKGGESLTKGLYLTYKYPFLAIHAKGEKVLAQSKRTTPPPISKICSLSIYIKEVFLKIFKLVSYF